jgi:hypothetical protein
MVTLPPFHFSACVWFQPHELTVMKFLQWLVIAVLFALSSIAADKGAAESCPPATVLTDKDGWQAGVATYTARQEKGVVTVTATGSNPTAAYQVQLAREPMKIFPPKFAFYRKPPGGIVAQVITPFSVCATFKADARVEVISVRDAKGEHRVSVDATP